MCSYRKPSPNELSTSDIGVLADQLAQFGLRQIVYSGGEPLTRLDFGDICEIFRRKSIRQTLLTNGLLLEKRSDLLRYFSEVIVSIDGSTSATHDSIRGIRSFDQILRGIREVSRAPSKPRLSLRTVVQKRNFRELPALVHFAKSVGADRISFLAADMLSDAFSRESASMAQADEAVLLNEHEISEYRAIIDEMSVNFVKEFETSFIAESPRKLYHIGDYFEAVLGSRPFPRNQCNAPMVSAVITSTGEIKPCFFLPSFGNVRSNAMPELMNRAEVRTTRIAVQDYRLERCHTCVCTLKKGSFSALMNEFD
jgi:MoaA/NifB/PqqE/SkfB family radical SAM enzyme